MYANLEVLNQEIAIAMEVLSDVLIAPSFPIQAVEREKKSQIAAIDQELDSPLGMANIAARDMLFGDHPYGNMRLGDKKIVSSITEQDLAEFHSQYAVSENSIISVCGSIEESAIRDHIEELFASMRNGEEYFSVYNGNIEISMMKNDFVKSGMQIGSIKKQNILSFQMWENKKPINPEKWLQKK